jgi:hypothetical protein
VSEIVRVQCDPQAIRVVLGVDSDFSYLGLEGIHSRLESFFVVPGVTGSFDRQQQVCPGWQGCSLKELDRLHVPGSKSSGCSFATSVLHGWSGQDPTRNSDELRCHSEFKTVLVSSGSSPHQVSVALTKVVFVAG